ncbi:from the Czech roh meaning corner [Striga hermonthica]|uniref:From the Czech roh meaning corner n=1 Tax=Striga hermonthica TaxID=68872 RepID=A0A9N7NTJ6_STRHE|nr:from the Czech roh meaning corner [Striga hermonthica]
MDQSSFLNLISIRRNQVPLDQELDDLELFQKHVSIRFSYLLPSSSDSSTITPPDNPAAPPPPFLSIPWLRDLLDTFLCCEAEFKAVLILDRDPSQFSPARGPGGCWGQPIAGLVEKIGEEWKKKEKSGGAGLLEEVVRMEKAAQTLAEMAEGFVYPMEEERATEVAAVVEELAEVCRRMEEGLGPLKKQVREVFHRMVRSRAEILDVLDQVSKSSVPVPY